MHDILVVLIHSIVTVVRLIKPGGLGAVVAESALTRHQLLILNRHRKRAPNLRVRSPPNLSLNSVITGVSAFCPIILWLGLHIRDPGDRLDILQAEFYRRKQA